MKKLCLCLRRGRLLSRPLQAVLMAAVSLLPAAAQEAARQWTLDECISYAIENNISLRKAGLQRQSAAEDVLQSRAALLPSLDFSTSHSVSYSPWLESGKSTVANGYVESNVDKVFYNGSYSLGASWTVWNGNKNRNTLRLNRLTEQQSAVDSTTTAKSIEEQIIQLYIQILYSADAIEVNKASLEASKKNEERGQAMLEVGSMSRADVAQLTAQRAQDEYNVVAAESQLRTYKRQMKQLLEITETEEFDVATPSIADSEVLGPIPALASVYANALNNRPEIKSELLAIESSDLNIKIAKAGRMPTIALSASVGTNSTTMSSTAWGSQLKTNFDASAGVSLSLPIFDNRSTRTTINKARISRETSQLELREIEKTLYATIEGYWLDATTNQDMFRAAIASVESEQASYDLLSEQFALGLKNIVELMTGKANLLSAQQSALQSKYMTLMNMKMLELYNE